MQDDLLERLNEALGEPPRCGDLRFVVGIESLRLGVTIVRDLQGFCIDVRGLSGGRSWYPYVNLHRRPEPLGTRPLVGPGGRGFS